MPVPDVLIIGGGPAASAAALRCRQLGMSAVMLHQEDKYPAATESIHPGLQSLLRGLGMAIDPLVYARGTYTGIRGNLSFQSLNPNGDEIWDGHHIDKGKFCELFRQTAMQSGCEVLAETITSLLTKDHRVSGVRCVSGNSYQARYVIDCSGRSQLAGRFLKLRKKYYSPSLVAWSGRSVNGPDNLPTSFMTATDHWDWIAPESNGANSWTRLALKGWTDFQPPGALRGLALESPVKIWNMRWRVFRPVVNEGLLLCGDAGGIIDPAASQGIFMAVMSGIVAANCVGNILVNRAAESVLLAGYDHWFLGEYEKKAKKLKLLYAELMPDWYVSNWGEVVNR